MLCSLRFTGELIHLILSDYSVMTNAFIRTLLLVNFLAFCSLAFLFKFSNPAVLVTAINTAQKLHLISVQVGRAEFLAKLSTFGLKCHASSDFVIIKLQNFLSCSCQSNLNVPY